jgi:hypothetical protein
VATSAFRPRTSIDADYPCMQLCLKPETSGVRIWTRVVEIDRRIGEVQAGHKFDLYSPVVDLSFLNGRNKIRL